VVVREAIAAGTLRPGDKGPAEVAARWDQLIRFAALRMGRALGIEVQPALSRRELAESAIRAQALADALVRGGALDGGLCIPNAVGTVQITADLRASRIIASVDIEAPREGRAATRINWLLRQLRVAPENVRIDAFALHSRAGTSALLKDVRLEPDLLVEDPKRQLRTFRLALSAPMGTKRAQGRGSFVNSVLDLVDGFYGSVVQNLRPWAPAAPKLRQQVDLALPGVPTQLVSTAVSSQDQGDVEAGIMPVGEQCEAAQEPEPQPMLAWGTTPTR
jgi:hypothetical protein